MLYIFFLFTLKITYYKILSESNLLLEYVIFKVGDRHFFTDPKGDDDRKFKMNTHTVTQTYIINLYIYKTNTFVASIRI